MSAACWMRVSPLLVALVLWPAEPAPAQVPLVPAPPTTTPKPKVVRAPITETDVLRWIDADLQKVPEKEQATTRYLSLAHLYNVIVSTKSQFDDEVVKRKPTGRVRLDFQPGAPLTLALPSSATIDERFSLGLVQLLASYRRGLSMLLNSLSWSERIVRPEPVDRSQGTVFRINLQNYRGSSDRSWAPAQWDRLLQRYPYGVTISGDAVAERIAKETGCAVPYVKADWFAFTASRPPLYHDLLGLPTTVATLERLLKVDVAENIRTGKADRIGVAPAVFSSSPSRNNRLLERHDLGNNRYYWKSYDFADGSGSHQKNLFRSPLGPTTDPRNADQFRPDGMEIIFSLPNGLQAYLIANANGDRLDQAPIEIVQNSRHRPYVVVTGLTCMVCHDYGLMPTVRDEREKTYRPEAKDRVLAHVERNAASFSSAELKQVRRLYKPEKKVNAKMARDGERFRRSLLSTATDVDNTDGYYPTYVSASGAEPYFSIYWGDPTLQGLAQCYDVELNVPRAAAEVGLDPKTFGAKLALSRPLARRFLLNSGVEADESSGQLSLSWAGAVKRQAFEDSFESLVAELGYGGYPKEQVKVWKPAPPDRPDTDDPGHHSFNDFAWVAGLLALAALAGSAVGLCLRRL